MDNKKIGEFLRELRKQMGMTQEQLGEQIGVTNKTVSRWENGNYMPPVNCLKVLSDIYSVSINEILSGERLKQKEYIDAAEDNISAALTKAEENNDRFEKRMFIIMGLTSILAVVVMFLLPKVTQTEDKLKEIIIIVLVLAMAFISNTLNIVALVINKKK